MTKKTYKLLYYPNIEFNDEDYAWLIRAAFLWDEIYRIVPQDYTPQDSDLIKTLTESGEIGKHLTIKPYECDIENDWDIENIRNQATEDFLNDYKDFLNIFELINPDWKDNITRFFCSKADYKFMKNLDDYNLILGFCGYNSESVFIPKVIGDIYMSYLSNIIASKKGMSIATSKMSAWQAHSCLFTANNKPTIEQNYGFDCLPIYINDIIPENCMEIDPKKILDFRSKRLNERQEFLNTYEHLCTKLTNAYDTQNFIEIWNSEAQNINTAIKNYKKSCDMISVSKWCGRIALPVKLASGILDVFDICNKVKPFIKATAGTLDIGKIYFQKKFNAFSKQHKSPYDYLFEVHNFVSPKKRIDLKPHFKD